MAHRRRRKQRERSEPALKKVTARIEKIGAQGDGVAMVEEKSVYAPLTAPGDEVKLACRGERGVLEDIITPSPHRAAPPCCYFGACGGCALQHVSDDFYRDWKRRLVIDALTREGFDEEIVAPLVACPPASRRRARFAVRRTAAGLVFGFNARASANIIDIDSCVILTPALDAMLPRLRVLAAAAPSRWRRFDLAVTLCDNGADIVLTDGEAAEDLTGQERLQLADAAKEAKAIRLSIDAAPVIVLETPSVRFGDVAVSPPPGGFLQASREGEDALAGFVTQQSGNARRVADLFSGCGTFSFPLARRAIVHAVDGEAAAIAALDEAARKADLRHPLTSERRNLFDRPLTPEALNPFDAVVFDPPRAGAQAQAAQLARSRVPIVISVSCNPASFARDASVLRAGGYVLSQVLPVDQFVYSAHVELAGLFTKE